MYYQEFLGIIYNALNSHEYKLNIPPGPFPNYIILFKDLSWVKIRFLTVIFVLAHVLHKNLNRYVYTNSDL